MGHSDIIFDNAVLTIRELIEYHSGEDKYYLCELEDTVNLFTEIFKGIGLMDLFYPTYEQIEQCKNSNWREHTIKIIRSVYDEMEEKEY